MSDRIGIFTFLIRDCTETQLSDVKIKTKRKNLSGHANQTLRNRFFFQPLSEIIIEHQDESGNRFKVSQSGKNISLPSSQTQKKTIRNFGKHTPRFFIIHDDSSGTEFLREEDIIDYMTEVEIDPMTAIIRDNIQGYPNVIGTTILRPIKGISN